MRLLGLVLCFLATVCTCEYTSGDLIMTANLSKEKSSQLSNLRMKLDDGAKEGTAKMVHRWDGLGWVALDSKRLTLDQGFGYSANYIVSMFKFANPKVPRKPQVYLEVYPKFSEYWPRTEITDFKLFNVATDNLQLFIDQSSRQIMIVAWKPDSSTITLLYYEGQRPKYLGSFSFEVKLPTATSQWTLLEYGQDFVKGESLWFVAKETDGSYSYLGLIALRSTQQEPEFIRLPGSIDFVLSGANVLGVNMTTSPALYNLTVNVDNPYYQLTAHLTQGKMPQAAQRPQKFVTNERNHMVAYMKDPYYTAICQISDKGKVTDFEFENTVGDNGVTMDLTGLSYGIRDL